MYSSYVAACNISSDYFTPWTNFVDVGLTELYDSCYRVQSQEVSSVTSILELGLMAAVAPLELTPLEARAVESALTIMSNKNSLDKLHNDVKIYIEACIA